jgi:hypothetical protein
LAPSKAKELKVTTGDLVVLVGRRRRAALARVQIAKGNKKSVGAVSANMAANLRLRSDDKVKIIAYHSMQTTNDNDTDTTSEDSSKTRSGDLLLLRHLTEAPSVVQSVTLAPLEDSLKQLESSEGGDELSEDEIRDRFVRPYMEECEGALIKKGHTLTLRDEQDKKLEFVVTHVGLEGEEEDKSKKEDFGKYMNRNMREEYECCC